MNGWQIAALLGGLLGLISLFAQARLFSIDRSLRRIEQALQKSAGSETEAA